MKPNWKSDLFHIALTIGLVWALGWALVQYQKRHQKLLGSPNIEIKYKP